MPDNIRFEGKELEEWLKRNADRIKPELKTSTRLLATRTLGYIKRTLPKRTGTLRRQYVSDKINDFQYDVNPGNSRYAGEVEEGGDPRTIVPKRKKFLLFGIEDKALVKSKAKLKQSAKNKFWQLVKEGETFEDATKKTGVVAARKVRTKGIRAQYNIRDKVGPFVDKEILKEVNEILNKITGDGI